MSTLENGKALPCGDGVQNTQPHAETRRGFVAALAKAAIVPAVVAGIAANVDPAHAR